MRPSLVTYTCTVLPEPTPEVPLPEGAVMACLAPAPAMPGPARPGQRENMVIAAYLTPEGWEWAGVPPDAKQCVGEALQPLLAGWHWCLVEWYVESPKLEIVMPPTTPIVLQ